MAKDLRNIRVTDTQKQNCRGKEQQACITGIEAGHKKSEGRRLSVRLKKAESYAKIEGGEESRIRSINIKGTEKEKKGFFEGCFFNTSDAADEHPCAAFPVNHNT